MNKDPHHILTNVNDDCAIYLSTTPDMIATSWKLIARMYTYTSDPVLTIYYNTEYKLPTEITTSINNNTEFHRSRIYYGLC